MGTLRKYLMQPRAIGHMDATHVFLDLYGTLTEGDGVLIASICEEIAAARDGLRASQLIQAWGQEIWEALRLSEGPRFRPLVELEAVSLHRAGERLGVVIDPGPHVDRLEAYWNKPSPCHDAADFIQQLRRPVCVVTNADRHNAVAALEHLQVHVDHVVTSEDARSYKPNPAVFTLALERTGWSTTETVHIGDSVHGDIHPADSIGLRTILVRRPGRPFDPGQKEATVVVDDLMAVAQLLSSAHTTRHIARGQQ